MRITFFRNDQLQVDKLYYVLRVTFGPVFDVRPIANRYYYDVCEKGGGVSILKINKRLVIAARVKRVDYLLFSIIIIIIIIIIVIII